VTRVRVTKQRVGLYQTVCLAKASGFSLHYYVLEDKVLSPSLSLLQATVFPT